MHTAPKSWLNYTTNIALRPRLNVYFSLQLDKNHSDIEDVDSWHIIPDLGSDSSSKTVFGLKPNSTYYFRVYAVNELGPGPNVSVEAETKFNAEEVDEANQLMSETGVSLYMK